MLQQFHRAFYCLDVNQVREYHYPKLRGQWAFPSALHSTLIASIGSTLDSLERGPAATPKLMLTAIETHFGLPPASVPDVGKGIPDRVLKNLAARVNRVSARVSQRLERYANEDQATGEFFGRLEGRFQADGWQVRLSTQAFSTHKKEPTLGADGAIIVEVEDDTGVRVMKAMLIQAKLVQKLPRDVLKLPRLKEQVRAMRRRTTDAYALIYSPDGLIVRGGNLLNTRLTPQELIIDALRCRRGDRDTSVIVDAMDRTSVLNIRVAKT